MARKKIHEDDFWYDKLRYLVDYFVFKSYARIKYVGLENIPSDGTVILAPNHCNALMDPLVVMAATHEKKVFVARADIFKKEKIASILNFFKIMPINRRRDGIRSVKNTEETIKKSIDVLNNRTKFCILPEGTHRPKHSLLKIGKGIARVAYGAFETIEEGCNVYILPIGCEYGDYYRFRSTAHVKIGEPINITEYIRKNRDLSEHDLYEGIRSLTDEAMKDQIVYLPDDSDYEGSWALTKIGAAHLGRLDVAGRFDEDRKIIREIQQLKEEMPERMAELMAKAEQFEKDRKAAGITLNAVSRRRPVFRAVEGTLNLLVGLPLFIYHALAALPVWLPAEILVKKTEDKAFCNSLRCGIMTFVWPVVFLMEALVLFLSVRWYWALAALALALPAPIVVYDYFEMFRQGVSRWKAVFNRPLRRRFRDLSTEFENTRKELKKDKK